MFCSCGFVAVECVNGSCPIANAEEYAMCDMDVTISCEDCYHFTQKCENCIITDICPDFKKNKEIDN